jgi:CRISPR system Cascade subunit CasB
MSTEMKPKTGKSDAFVQFIVEKCKDNGTAAALKRADNPATEYQSWEFLAAFNIDLEKPWQRIPYAAIAAAIARAKPEHNGRIGIGAGIARCYEDGNQSDQAKARLRRLLACQSSEEACRILRPLFSLIGAKGNVSLDYARLLNQLLRFNLDSQTVKTQWAMDFYNQKAKAEEEAAA